MDATTTSRQVSPVATLAVLCLALFMAVLDSTAITLTLPMIRADLGADLTGLIWIADGYVLAFASLLLTAGSLGDRLGRVALFRAGIVVFTAGSALCAAAPNLATLIAGRIVQGLGAALVGPQTLAILVHAFPEQRQRSRAFGIWSGVSGLALLFGPVLGGTFAAAWGWRSVFLINLPIGALTLIIGARSMPKLAGTADRPDAPLHHAIDLPGQLLTTLWLGTLTFALIEGARLGWSSPVIVVLLVISLCTLGLLLTVERRVPHPMLHLELFRSRTFTASTVAIGLISFGMYTSFFMISIFLQQVQDYSAAAAGVRFLPAMVAVVLTAPLAGLAAGRYGARPPVLAGTLLIGVSLLLLARIGTGSPYHDWWPLMTTFGIGIGLVMSSLNNALMGSVPSSRAGLASATGEAGQQIGALVGIAVVGLLVIGGFQRVVAKAAAGASLSDQDVARLARNLFATDGGASGTLGGSPAQTIALVHRALTAGIHNGLAAAGIAALCATAVALLIRSPKPVAAGAAGTEASYVGSAEAASTSRR
jgi:EmrB/QacA subfamily drug resistance transporter